jgi:hypothetical protein
VSLKPVFQIIGATHIRNFVFVLKEVNIKHNLIILFLPKRICPPEPSFNGRSGEGEIRTREEVSPLEVFKTSALDQLCDLSQGYFGYRNYTIGCAILSYAGGSEGRKRKDAFGVDGKK